MADRLSDSLIDMGAGWEGLFDVGGTTAQKKSWFGGKGMHSTTSVSSVHHLMGIDRDSGK